MTKQYFIITLICLSLSFVAGSVFSTLNARDNTDLEVYTNYTIYYIKGLTVTEEASDTVLRFKDKESLKSYISEMTSQDIWYK